LERIGAHVRLISQGKIWSEVEKMWQIHDRIGESCTCIRVLEELRKGKALVKTQCGRGRWDLIVGKEWKEAEMIWTLMAHYRPTARQPPRLAIFDEEGRRKDGFEVRENWTYVLITGKDEKESEEKGQEEAERSKGPQREFLERDMPDINAPGSQTNGQTRDFIEGSTPDISTPNSQDADEEQAQVQMRNEVVYGNRKMSMMLSGLSAEEAHTRIREAMGVPDEASTGLQWERVGESAHRFTLLNVWAEQREWHEGQGINVRLGRQSAEERVRGEDGNNEEVHKMVSWTRRNNYPMWVGISLPIPDQVGGEFHEGQLWEETPDDMIISERHAEVVYNWLMERLGGRSSENMSPVEMTLMVEGATVRTWKDGKGGYILFTPEDSIMTPMKKMEMQIMIEYEQGYMRVGMENVYTIEMLAWEFQQLTQRQWGFYPVVHRVTKDFDLFQAARADQELQVPPPKVLEERGRGTLITKVTNQGRLLQYWAWLQQPLEVGVLIPTERLKIEYWMSIALQPVPYDEDPTTYPRMLKGLWLERLRGISNIKSDTCLTVYESGLFQAQRSMKESRDLLRKNHVRKTSGTQQLILWHLPSQRCQTIS
jgi:hypothetical protein